LRGKNRINSSTIFFASFFYSLLVYCFLSVFMNASHLGEQKKEEKKAMRHAMAQSKTFGDKLLTGASPMVRS